MVLSRLIVSRALIVPALSLAAVAGCGGKGGARFAQPGDVPADLLTRLPEAQRPVVVRDGVAYLFLRFSNPLSDGDAAPALELPGCWTDGGSSDDGAAGVEGQCATTIPASPELAQSFGALPAALTVVGVDGPCQAKVGAPVVVKTSGCEPSAMVAAPLTGCPVEVAPIGRVDGGFDAELRWRPAPTGEAVAAATVQLFDGAAKLADPVERATVAAWLAEPELNAGTRRDSNLVDVQIDAGAEALESIHGGFLIGDGASECEWITGHRAAVGLRRGDVLTPIDVPAEWDGALIWRGRVVGVASGQPRDVVLHAVRPDGTTAVAFEADVWWDNEECTQGGWAQVEYPCGP